MEPPHLISTSAKLAPEVLMEDVARMKLAVTVTDPSPCHGTNSSMDAAAFPKSEKEFLSVLDVLESGAAGGWEFDAEEREAAVRQAAKGLGSLFLFALFRKVVLKL